MGDHAFENCETISTLVIPAEINKLGLCAFKNCTRLSSITINGDIADCNAYSTDPNKGGFNYYADKSVFYNAGANADSLTVIFGDEVTRIPAYLFATGGERSDPYAYVTDVVIGGGVQSIGDCAFYHCYDLPEVTVPSAVTVGEQVFD